MQPTESHRSHNGSSLTSITTALQKAAATGETILIRYSGGSHRGQERFLTVLNLGPGTSVQVRSPGENSCATYRLNNILKVTFLDGTETVNREATAIFEDYLLGYQDRKAEEARLAGDTVATSLPIKVLHDPRPWEYTLIGVGWHKALVRATGKAEIEKVCELLSHCGRSGPVYWTKIAKLLQCRLRWPGFDAYVDAIRTEGEALRLGAPRLRDLDLPLGRHFEVNRADYRARLALYGSSKVRPPSDDRSDRQLDRVRLFESDNYHLAVYSQLAHDLSPQTLGVYLAWADTTHRVRDDLPNADISAEQCRELRSAGLLLTLSEAPVELIVERLTVRELSGPIMARGLTPKKRAPGWAVAFYKSRMDADFEHALRVIAEAKGLHAFMPPRGQSWEEFQDFRALYTQMGDLLSDWLLGGSIPKPLEVLVHTGGAAASVLHR